MISRIIFHSIFIISILNYYLLLFTIFKAIISPKTDIFQYKIKYFKLNILYTIIYSIIFLIILYCWRIYNINQILDLKRSFDFIHRMWLINISHISLGNQFYLFLIILFIVLALYFCLLNIHVNFYSSLYNLYIYYYHAFISKKENKMLTKFRHKLCEIGSFYLITHLLYELYTYFTLKRLEINPKFLTSKLNWYHPLKIFGFFIVKKIFYIENCIAVSPIIIVLYDIIFNHFIITHLYYYLLLYIPLVLLKRVSTVLSQGNPILISVIGNMFYAENNDTIYAVDSTRKKLLDFFVRNGFCSNLETDELGLYLGINLSFISYRPERNAYMNDLYVIVITAEGRVFKEEEHVKTLYNLLIKEEYEAFKLSGLTEYEHIYYELGEELYLLADKRLLRS